MEDVSKGLDNVDSLKAWILLQHMDTRCPVGIEAIRRILVALTDLLLQIKSNSIFDQYLEEILLIYQFE